MVTIQQIAKETGFSPSTVSIVLNGKGDARSISPATQEAVQAAAQRMNYRPSISAKALRGGSANEKMLGLYFSADYRSAMMNRFTNGLWAYPPCQNPDLNIIITPYQVGALSHNCGLKSLNRFHGVILCNMDTADMEYLASQRPAMPAVLYNRTSPGYSSVTVNNAELGRIPAQVFAEHGCKTAAILCVANPFPGLDSRVQAFIDHCRMGGVQVLPPVECRELSEGGYQAIEALRDSGAAFDCLFCTADVLVFGAVRALLEHGVRIPADVEVISIGNGDPQQAQYSWPSLSQVQVPIEAMAQECFRLIMRQIENRTQQPAASELPVLYLPRESTKAITK